MDGAHISVIFSSLFVARLFLRSYRRALWVSSSQRTIVRPPLQLPEVVLLDPSLGLQGVWQVEHLRNEALDIREDVSFSPLLARAVRPDKERRTVTI